MEYTITWGGDPEDVCWSLRGVATTADLDAIKREAISDPRWVSGMKVLVDCTDADLSGLKASDIQERADTVLKWADQVGRQQVAYAVSDHDSYSVVRLLLLRLDWQVELVGRVFRSLQEAREWLRQPPDVARAHAGPRP